MLIWVNRRLLSRLTGIGRVTDRDGPQPRPRIENSDIIWMSASSPSSPFSNASFRARSMMSETNWDGPRSEEHTSEVQSLMRISYAVCGLQKNINPDHHNEPRTPTTPAH